VPRDGAGVDGGAAVVAGEGEGAAAAGAGAGWRCSKGAGVCVGSSPAQPDSAPTIDHHAAQIHPRPMWLLIAEALAALVILVLIVWWTMFSGRNKGELPRDDDPR